jgi:hypothetical protein
MREKERKSPILQKSCVSLLLLLLVRVPDLSFGCLSFPDSARCAVSFHFIFLLHSMPKDKLVEDIVVLLLCKRPLAKHGIAYSAQPS